MLKNIFKFISTPPRKSYAFTLAEVLITLSIIGVIAAVTIPNVINHYEQRVTVTKVKKMYSTLSEAYDRYLVNNNYVVPTYAATSGTTKMYEDLVKPYMQVSVNAGKNPTEKQKIMYNGQYKWLDGTKHANYCSNEIYYTVQLKDNSVLWFTGKRQGVTANSFRYDVNGKKGPNTIGKDLFFFSITDKGIIPGSSNTYQTPQEIAANCINTNNVNNDDDDDDNSSNSGSACTAYIIVHGNMDYLK